MPFLPQATQFRYQKVKTELRKLDNYTDKLHRAQRRSNCLRTKKRIYMGDSNNLKIGSSNFRKQIILKLTIFVMGHNHAIGLKDLRLFLALKNINVPF